MEAAEADKSASYDGVSYVAREVVQVLESKGASFFLDLVRHTGRLASEVEDGLWELVAGGLVTADGFDNLRALIDPKRRRGEGAVGARVPVARRGVGLVRHSPPRWHRALHRLASRASC